MADESLIHTNINLHFFTKLHFKKYVFAIKVG